MGQGPDATVLQIGRSLPAVSQCSGAHPLRYFRALVDAAHRTRGKVFPRRALARACPPTSVPAPVHATVLLLYSWNAVAKTSHHGAGLGRAPSP